MKGELHPRNRHQGPYDFVELQGVCPELSRHVVKNHSGKDTIDFASPVAVKILNQALLKKTYSIEHWDIPDQYLCPPIPGRADYIHHLADLLAEKIKGEIPRGPTVRVLDIGVGANCIYPILGNREYGWSFVGADLDPVALQSAQHIVDSNPVLNSIELRLQKHSPQILKGVILPGEKFDLSMCNPPFHASAEEADSVNQRKWRNLGKGAVANFGGRSNELWCEGGEVAFVGRMIQESADLPSACRWFTSLVSKEASLHPLYQIMKKVKARETQTISMEQGQKKTRFVAWRFAGS